LSNSANNPTQQKWFSYFRGPTLTEVSYFSYVIEKFVKMFNVIDAIRIPKGTSTSMMREDAKEMFGLFALAI